MSTVILPPGSTDTDLQNAIDQAVFGDFIQISGDMPFTTAVTVRSGLEITVQSTPGNSFTMQQFNQNIRHFKIDGSLILENITLDGRSAGGGVQLNQGAFAMLGGAVIQNCAADNGGGVEVIKGVFSVYGGIIQDNTALNGGGVYIHAGLFNMSASAGYIISNQADNGGGIYIAGGSYLLSGGEINENEAVDGGGLYINAGIFEMTRGMFKNNNATGSGGGIYISEVAALNISGASAITRNKAANGGGGGIYTAHTAHGNIKTGSSVVFSCNIASNAFSTPEPSLYPDIHCAHSTVLEHPLNNYDICYTGGQPVSVTHSIIYAANGGSGGHTGTDTEPCETDIVLSPADSGVSRPGYEFTGWNTKPDGSGIDYMPGDEILLPNDLILYAQWRSLKPDCMDCYRKCRRICREVLCKIRCNPCCSNFICCFCEEFSKEFCREFCGADRGCPENCD